MGRADLSPGFGIFGTITMDRTINCIEQSTCLCCRQRYRCVRAVSKPSWSVTMRSVKWNMMAIFIWWTCRIWRVSHSRAGCWRGMVRGAVCWPLVGISRTDRSVGACNALGITFVCQVGSPVISVMWAAVTWAVTSVVTWRPREGAFWRHRRMRISMSQTRTHQDRASQIRGRGARRCFERELGTSGGCVRLIHSYNSGLYTVRRPGGVPLPRGAVSIETSRC